MEMAPLEGLARPVTLDPSKQRGHSQDSPWFCCIALRCSAIRVAFTFRNPCYAERGPLYETSALGAQAKSDGSPLACGLADWRTWLALDNARKRKGAGRAVGARFGLPLNRLQGGTDPRDGVCLVIVKSIEQGLSLSRS